MYLSLCHDAGDGVQRGMEAGMFFGWVGGGLVESVVTSDIQKNPFFLKKCMTQQLSMRL